MAVSTPFKQPCPSCEAPVTVREASQVGKKIECPKCKYRFVVEAPAESKKAAIKSKAAAGKKQAEDDEEVDLDEEEEDEEEAAPAKGKDKDKVKANGKAKAPAKSEDDEDEDEEEKPKGKDKDKKKKKKKAAAGEGMDKKKLGLILGGVAVLLLAVVGVIMMMGGPKKDTGKGAKDGGKKDSSKVAKDGGKKKDKDKEGGNQGSGSGTAVRATPALTNLVPRSTESYQHFFFKNYLDSPPGVAAVDSGVLDDGVFLAHLGFAPSAIDELIRAESFTNEWTLTVIHLTENVDEARLNKALDLQMIKKKVEPYYKVRKNGGYAESLSRLALGVPAYLRNHPADPAAAAKAQPLVVRLHDRHTLIFAHETGMKKFLAENPVAKPAPKEKVKEKEKEAGADKGDKKGKFKDKKGPPPEVIKKKEGGEDKKEETKEEPQAVEQPYSVLSDNLKGMIKRLREAGKDSEQIVISAIDLKAVAVREKLVQQGALQPRLQWQLRLWWDLADVLGENAGKVSVLGTAVRKKDDLLVYANELDYTGKEAGKTLTADLKDRRAAELAHLYGKMLQDRKTQKDFEIALPKEPEEMEKKKEGTMEQPGTKKGPGKIGVGPIGAGSGGGKKKERPGPGPGTKKEEKEKEEAKEEPKSRIVVTQKDGTVQFTLELLLTKDNLRNHFGPAFRALLYGFKTDLALAGGAPRYSDLARAGARLGVYDENGSKRKVEEYGPGAYPRRGTARHAQEPINRVGWMAGLLPHLGHTQLYKQIAFNRSWKDPDNWLAAQTLVPEFIDPSYPLRTRYLSSTGMPLGTAATHFAGLGGIGRDVAEAAYGDDPKLGVFGYDRFTPLKDMKRGASNTILMVRVPYDGTPGATPWIAGGGSTIRTVPAEDSLQPFLTKENGGEGTYLLMADSSVRYVKAAPKGTDERKRQDELFRKLATVKEDWADPDDAKKLDKELGPKVTEAEAVKPAPVVKEKGPVQKEKKEPVQKEKETTKGEKAKTGGKEFSPPDGNFTVLMPGTPKEIEVPGLKKDPKAPPTKSYMAVEQDKVFLVTWTSVIDDLKTPLEQRFTNFKQGLLNGIPGGAKLLKESKVSLDGKYEGREFQIEASGKTLYSRVYIVGVRYYTLTAIAPPADAQPFFKSFALLKY